MNVKSKSKSSREAGDFKWLTLEEISTFLNHVATRVDKSDDPDNKYDPVKYIALFNLAYQHGLRRQEIVNLTVGDYDRERKTIRVVRVKGGLKRIYPLSKEAVIQLNNWLKHRESEMNIKNTPDSPLFCNTRGEKSNPFGLEALAPLVVAIQALVLLGTFGYAAVDAVGVLLRGGSQTELGPALAYGILSLVACTIAYVVLARAQHDSELVAAEAIQWRAAVVLGAAMTIGFGAAVALTRTRWAGAASYVDPLLVLVAAALILPAPVRMLRQSFRELLEGVPDAEVADPINAAIAAVRADFGLPEPTARMGKLGRKIYLDLDFLVGEDEGWTVDHADQVHRQLRTKLSEPGRMLWINVELHTDPDWDD